MIETPEITNSRQVTVAVIHIKCPREKIQSEVGPAIKEILAALASEGHAPQGPMFMHHLTMSKSHFDVELGFPINAPLGERARKDERTARGASSAHDLSRTLRGPFFGLGRVRQTT